MRFYPGALEYLYKIRHRRQFDQQLYLVADVKNEHDVHAVMLHNGKQKLGHIAATEVVEIKKMLTQWSKENGGSRDDDVIVCHCDTIGFQFQSFEDFKFTGSIRIRGINRVNERLARKFADQIHTKKE